MANDFGNGGGFGLDKEVSNKLKSPNVHEKEDEYTGRMVLPIMTFKFVMGVLSVLCGAAFYLFQIRNFLHLAGKIPVYGYCIIPVIFVASLILLHGVTIDVWVPHVANSRIGSSYCKIGLKTITMDYDVLNSKKDINKFVEEITDKSEDWNYFIKKISPRSMTIKLSVRPKVKIPTKADFKDEYVSNEQWNYIPLGICLTDESVLGTVNWMLNDNNKVKGSHKATIPSTSFLVAGGTGSGKSVLENNIIRHCNTFSDNFQAMLVDVKRVEFGGLSNLEGIKAVALDIAEAEACLRASREIMYSRFKFMEKSGVNNVYKLKDFKCSYFCIENPQSGVRRLYQFDEIFYSEVDGKVEITTIDELYKKTESSEVKIYFSGQKENSLKVERDIERCKSNPGSLFIREITPGDFYSFNKQIFAAKATLKTDNGDMTAEQIFDIVSKGKTVNINGTPANKDNYSCIECTFKPKAILTVVDEMSEVMSTTDYKAQASISDSISSIARLGRAAACHLCLATQRPSGNVISSDLKNNIQMTTLLGGFGTSESTLCFDEDISDFCKPEIKGRGFVKTGNDIYEYQSFWIGDPKYKLKDKAFETGESVSNDISVTEAPVETKSEMTPMEPVKDESKPVTSDLDDLSPEEKRQRRLENRRKKKEALEAKKEAEFDALIEKESEDEDFEEVKRPKDTWDAEDFFNNEDSKESKSDSETPFEEEKPKPKKEHKSVDDFEDDFEEDFEKPVKKRSYEEDDEDEDDSDFSDFDDFETQETSKPKIKINVNKNNDSKNGESYGKKTIKIEKKTIKINIHKNNDDE